LRDETISVEELADKGFMSVSVARARKEAWAAVTEALRAAGRLKAAPKAKPTLPTPPAVEPVGTAGAI
jgi:hypothetical protein